MKRLYRWLTYLQDKRTVGQVRTRRQLRSSRLLSLLAATAWAPFGFAAEAPESDMWEVDGISGVRAQAIGKKAKANGDDATAYGAEALADDEGATALGAKAKAFGVDSVALGHLASASQEGNVALGASATASGERTVAVGAASSADGDSGTALGNSASADGDFSTAVGYGSWAREYQATALGHTAWAMGEASTAVGQGAKVFGDNATAVGQAAFAMSDDSTALGRGASAEADNSIALGAYSTANRANTVSVGGVSTMTGEVQTRQITNVAAGTQATDAVNLSQLDSAVAAIDTSNPFVSIYGVHTTAPENGAQANSVGSLAIGVGASAYLQAGSAYQDELWNQGNTAIGSRSKATRTGTAVGFGAQAIGIGDGSVAVGNGALASGPSSLAIGAHAQARTRSGGLSGATGATAVGISATAIDNGAAFGWQSYADGALAIGNRVRAYNSSAVIDGYMSPDAWGVVAVGPLATVTANHAVAVGRQSGVHGAQGTSLGSFASVGAGATNGTALGSNSRVEDGQTNGTAVGMQARVSSQNSVALGAKSIAYRDNAVSIGNERGDEIWTDVVGDGDPDSYRVTGYDASTIINRQLVNLAAGTQDTDAVNVSQLRQSVEAFGGGADVLADGSVRRPDYALSTGRFNNVGDALSSLDQHTTIVESVAYDAKWRTDQLDQLAVKYDDWSRGSATLNPYGGSPTRLKNVAAGVDATDAVNLSQLTTAVGSSDAAHYVKFNNGLRDGSDDAVVEAEHATAVGVSAKASGIEATALGNGASAKWDKSTAIGAHSDAYGTDATAVGHSASARGNSSTALGAGSSATAYYSTAIGGGSSSAEGAAAIGHTAKASGFNSVAVGRDAEALDEDGIAIGTSSKVGTSGSMALGARAAADNGGSAFGQDASATWADSTAVGGGAKVNHANSVALGAGSTTRVGALNGYVDGTGLLGGQSSVGSVSVGSAAGNRQITNVAAGRDDHDAVNVEQLKVVQSKLAVVDDVATNSVQYDDASKAGVTLQGADGTRLSNVAQGEVSATSRDAINGSQLFEVKSELGGEITNVDQRVTVVEGDVNQLNQKLINLNGALDDAVLYDDASHASVSFNRNGDAVALKNVADGVEDTDAVNLRQLNTVQDQMNVINQNLGNLGNVVFYDGNGHDRVTLSGSSGTVIDNLADGRIAADSKEAINGSQIHALNEQINNRFGDVENRVTNIENNGGGSGGQPLVVGSGLMKADGDEAVEAAQVRAGSKGVALGANASVQADNSVALGAGSIADRDNTISVGNAGSERVITNVADGVMPTDAANVRQLEGMFSEARLYSDHQYDAVNSRIDGAYNAISEVDNEARRGIAAASALVNVTPYVPGATVVNAGVAHYRGMNAVGVGVSRWNRGGTVNLNAGVSSAGGDSTVVRAGVGFIIGK